jgi:hypothetical protein
MGPRSQSEDILRCSKKTLPRVAAPAGSFFGVCAGKATHAEAETVSGALELALEKRSPIGLMHFVGRLGRRTAAASHQLMSEEHRVFL